MAADGTLARLSRAEKALAAAGDFHDVLSIRDEAEAVRHLLKVRGSSLASQNRAASIKIRAEQKLGVSLAAMGLNGGDRKSELHDAKVKLKDIGVSGTNSHRWQAMSNVPEEQLAAMERKATESDGELTSKEVYKLGKSLASKKPVIHRVPIKEEFEIRDVPKVNTCEAQIYRQECSKLDIKAVIDAVNAKVG